jgi:hypothetical protein
LKIVGKNQYPLHLKAVFSEESKIEMEKLVELDKINEERLKKIKYQREVKDYRVIDPVTLPSKKICYPNFISEMLDVE